jgi:hypothetical protein
VLRDFKEVSFTWILLYIIKEDKSFFMKSFLRRVPAEDKTFIHKVYFVIRICSNVGMAQSV